MLQASQAGLPSVKDTDYLVTTEPLSIIGTMRPDLQCALVCEDVRLEASGANTLVGVMNVIPAPSLPIRVMKFCVYTRWVNGIGQYNQTTRILGPDDDNEMTRTETPFQLVNEDNHATNVAVFGGVEFTSAGDHPVEILLNGDLVLRFSLKVLPVSGHGM